MAMSELGGSPDYSDLVSRLADIKEKIDTSAAALPSDIETKSKGVANPIMKKAGSQETAETKEKAPAPAAKNLSDVKNSVKELAASTKQIYSQLKKMEGKPEFNDKYKSGWQTLQAQKQVLDQIVSDLKEIRLEKKDQKILKEITKKQSQINKILNKAQKANVYDAGKRNLWTKFKQLVGLKASKEAMSLRSQAYKEFYENNKSKNVAPSPTSSSEQTPPSRTHETSNPKIAAEFKSLIEDNVIPKDLIVQNSNGQVNVAATLEKLKTMSPEDCCRIFTKPNIYRTPNTLKLLLEHIPKSEKTDASVAMGESLGINNALGLQTPHAPHENYQAIYMATKMGHVGLTKLLLDFGADPNGKLISESTSFAETPLRLAIRSFKKDDQNLELLELLVKNGADVNHTGPRGLTPIAEAVTNGNIHVAKFLLERKADPFKASGDYTSHRTITCACKAPTTEFLELIYKKFPFDATKFYSKSAYSGSESAFFHASAANLEWLSDQGIDLDYKDSGGRTAFQFAAQRGDVKSLEYLLELNPTTNINQTDNKNRTPLWLALNSGHWDAAELLLTKGADLNIRTNASPLDPGSTPAELLANFKSNPNPPEGFENFYKVIESLIPKSHTWKRA